MRNLHVFYDALSRAKRYYDAYTANRSKSTEQLINLIKYRLRRGNLIVVKAIKSRQTRVALHGLNWIKNIDNDEKCRAVLFRDKKNLSCPLWDKLRWETRLAGSYWEIRFQRQYLHTFMYLIKLKYTEQELKSTKALC